MATPFTHTSLQTTLARPEQCGSGKTSSPATIGTRGPGIDVFFDSMAPFQHHDVHSTACPDVLDMSPGRTYSAVAPLSETTAAKATAGRSSRAV